MSCLDRCSPEHVRRVYKIQQEKNFTLSNPLAIEPIDFVMLIKNTTRPTPLQKQLALHVLNICRISNGFGSALITCVCVLNVYSCARSCVMPAIWERWNSGTYALVLGKPIDSKTSRLFPCLTAPGRFCRCIRGATLAYRSSFAAMVQLSIWL